MTKPACITVALMLAMIAAAGFLQHRSNAARQEENRVLRQRIAEANAPDEANQQRAGLQPAADPTSADDRAAELIRLRAKIEGLKLELAKTGQMAERDRTALAQAQADQTTAETALWETIHRTRNNLNGWGYAWTAYADKNQGQFPMSFEQARPFLLDGVPMENDLIPSRFDIIYQGSVSNLDNPNQLIVLRQKEAVQTPGNANWLRTYLFADGHSEIKSTPGGNFEAWGSQHKAANQ